MTTTAGPRKATTACNGVTTAFAVPFQFIANSDLYVYVHSSEDWAEATAILLTEGVDYTVSGDGPSGTATVTTAVAWPTGRYITRRRVTSKSQTADFVPGQAPSAEAMETQLDRLSLVTEELEEEIDVLREEGVTGLSAYDAWIAAGNTGTMDDFLSGRRKAVFLITLGQSLSKWQAHQVTVAVDGLYTFAGGTSIEQFPDFFDPTSNRDVCQNFANYASIVPFVPLTGYEIMAAGIGARIMLEPAVERCLIFSAGYSGQSARMMRQGTNMFADLVNAACEGVRILRGLGFYVELRFVYSQGHANADAFNDGLGAGETPTSTAQYVTILGKVRDSLWRAAQVATGLDERPTIWIDPLMTGGTNYAAADVRAIQEGQRSAVATLAGLRYGASRSGTANDFQNDLVHPYGEAIRFNAEATGAMMSQSLSPPFIVTALIGSNYVDVTFDQPVRLSSLLAEATGYANDAMGFQALTSGGAYVACTAAAMHPTDPKTVRVTVATATLTGGKILNGQQWTATGAASAFMPRTHVCGTADIGETLIGVGAGAPMENFAISQSKVLT